MGAGGGEALRVARCAEDGTLVEGVGWGCGYDAGEVAAGDSGEGG